MSPHVADSIVNAYADQRGYPTIIELNDMSKEEFEKGLSVWCNEYIEALPDAGLLYGLTGQIQNPTTGNMVRSEWGWKMQQAKKVLEFRHTEAGKKYLLNRLVTEKVRDDEKDMDDLLDTASISVVANTGSPRRDKKLTQINIRRLDHIKALEKSISKGGALRDAYDTMLMAHKDSIENLISNEDAAKSAMYSKKRNKIPALLLSWLVMPLYVILRSFDMFFDGGIMSLRLNSAENVYTEPKVGSNHPFLGRLSIPIVVGTFIGYVTAIIEYNRGSDLFTSRGILQSGLACSILATIGFIIAKQFLGVPFYYLTKIYGNFAYWASTRFLPLTADDFQLGYVTYTYQKQQLLGEMIKEREEIIQGLKSAIINNVMHSPYDSYYKNKSLSIKALKAEEEKYFNKTR